MLPLELNKPVIAVNDLRELGILYMNSLFPIGGSLYFASPNAVKTSLKV